MCLTIYNRATDEEIESPPQLRALTGRPLLPGGGYKTIDDAGCLCQVDVPGCLAAAGIAYECDGMAYVVSRPANPTAARRLPPRPLRP